MTDKRLKYDVYGLYTSMIILPLISDMRAQQSTKVKYTDSVLVRV